MRPRESPPEWNCQSASSQRLLVPHGSAPGIASSSRSTRREVRRPRSRDVAQEPVYRRCEGVCVSVCECVRVLSCMNHFPIMPCCFLRLNAASKIDKTALTVFNTKLTEPEEGSWQTLNAASLISIFIWTVDYDQQYVSVLEQKRGYWT